MYFHMRLFSFAMLSTYGLATSAGPCTEKMPKLNKHMKMCVFAMRTKKQLIHHMKMHVFAIITMKKQQFNRNSMCL